MTRHMSCQISDEDLSAKLASAYPGRRVRGLPASRPNSHRGIFLFQYYQIVNNTDRPAEAAGPGLLCPYRAGYIGDSSEIGGPVRFVTKIDTGICRPCGNNFGNLVKLQSIIHFGNTACIYTSDCNPLRLTTNFGHRDDRESSSRSETRTWLDPATAGRTRGHKRRPNSTPRVRVPPSDHRMAVAAL